MPLVVPLYVTTPIYFCLSLSAYTLTDCLSVHTGCLPLSVETDSLLRASPASACLVPLLLSALVCLSLSL